MSIRAKFTCRNVTHGVGVETVRLDAVTSGAGNESWSKYTPSGSVEMQITVEGAQGRFVPGKHYYLDFTPAEEAAAAPT